MKVSEQATLGLVATRYPDDSFTIYHFWADNLLPYQNTSGSSLISFRVAPIGGALKLGEQPNQL